MVPQTCCTKKKFAKDFLRLITPHKYHISTPEYPPVWFLLKVIPSKSYQVSRISLDPAVDGALHAPTKLRLSTIICIHSAHFLQLKSIINNQIGRSISGRHTARPTGGSLNFDFLLNETRIIGGTDWVHWNGANIALWTLSFVHSGLNEAITFNLEVSRIVNRKLWTFCHEVLTHYGWSIKKNRSLLEVKAVAFVPERNVHTGASVNEL